MPRVKRNVAAALSAPPTRTRTEHPQKPTSDGGTTRTKRTCVRSPPDRLSQRGCLLHRSLTRDAAAAASADRASAALNRDGYAVIPQFLASQTLRALRAEVDAVYRAKAPSIDGEWVLNLHQQLGAGGGWVWALASSPFVVKLLQAQLGPNIVLYCSQIHAKRVVVRGSNSRANPAADADADADTGRDVDAGNDGRSHSDDVSSASNADAVASNCDDDADGGDDDDDDPGDVPGVNSAVPWHQDGGANVRTLWISLDTVTAESGGLRVLRGGHRLGRLPYAPVATAAELAQAACVCVVCGVRAACGRACCLLLSRRALPARWFRGSWGYKERVGDVGLIDAGCGVL